MTENATEGTTVGIALGMDVPVYTGTLYPDTDGGYPGMTYVTPPCISKEIVRAYLVNEALRQLIVNCDNDVWQSRLLFRDDSENYDDLNDYINRATTSQIISDYKALCRADITIDRDAIVGVIPARYAPEDIESDDGY
jgi:hypothetical protein